MSFEVRTRVFEGPLDLLLQLITSHQLDMRDGVEDFELLRLLATKHPDKAREIAKDTIPTFTDYVRDAETFRAQRLKLLEAFE